MHARYWRLSAAISDTFTQSACRHFPYHNICVVAYSSRDTAGVLFDLLVALQALLAARNQTDLNSSPTSSQPAGIAQQLSASSQQHVEPPPGPSFLQWLDQPAAAPQQAQPQHAGPSSRPEAADDGSSSSSAAVTDLGASSRFAGPEAERQGAWQQRVHEAGHWQSDIQQGPMQQVLDPDQEQPQQWQPPIVDQARGSSPADHGMAAMQAGASSASQADLGGQEQPSTTAASPSMPQMDEAASQPGTRWQPSREDIIEPPHHPQAVRSHPRPPQPGSCS